MPGVGLASFRWNEVGKGFLVGSEDWTQDPSVARFHGIIRNVPRQTVASPTCLIPEKPLDDPDPTVL
jgi:hypothetical protein